MPAKCTTMNADGELPTCTYDGQRWTVTGYDSVSGFGGADPGIPSGFVGLFAIVLVIGIGLTVYKVSMARQMAARSGMSTGEATAMTLLTDNGLEATYLASSLRQSAPGAPPVPPEVARSVAERLAELESLRTQGLVSASEYEERRAAILADL